MCVCVSAGRYKEEEVTRKGSLCFNAGLCTRTFHTHVSRARFMRTFHAHVTRPAVIRPSWLDLHFCVLMLMTSNSLLGVTICW